VAFVCRGNVCLAPARSLHELKQALAGGGPAAAL
jgi:hypothetical protein